MSFWKRVFFRPSVSPKVAFPVGYTLEEFRSNAGLVVQTKQFLESKLGGHIMAALHNSAPTGLPMRASEMSDIIAAIELGKREGYALALEVLYALTIPALVEKEVPIDYGAEETEK